MNLKQRNEFLEEQNHSLTRNGFILLGMIVCLLLGIGLQATVHVSQRKVTCSDFKTYAQALQAFEDGATWLDRGGVPLIPCEHLLAKK